MTRVFRNGELQRAVLEVLAEDGPQHGYAILRSLSERLDGRWRASPGAVYPALLGLQDAGLIEAEMVDGTRTYSLSGAGRRAAGAAVGVVEQVRARAARALPVEPSAGVRGPTAAPRTLPVPHQDESPPATVGSLLVDFAARRRDRDVPLDPVLRDAVTALLDGLGVQLDVVINRGGDHG